jgi:hypothetical protein
VRFEKRGVPAILPMDIDVTAEQIVNIGAAVGLVEDFL